MAAASMHSSNPFRIQTPRGRKARTRRYGAMAPLRESLSSHDPLAGYGEDEDDFFRREGTKAARHLFMGEEDVIVHGDEDEDELLLTNADDEDQKTEIVESQEEQDIETDEEENDGESDDDSIDVEVEHGGDDEYDEESSELDSSYESDEEETLKRKPPEEQREILDEIHDLLLCVPQLKEDYNIIDRLGTGTFSSVYKAHDLSYNKMDNLPWHGHHPPESSAHYQSILPEHTSPIYVAIKRIYVTSNPERIRNEIDILEITRGCRHVSQIITAFRSEDQVVVVMPYNRNIDFRDFYRDISWQRIRDYFRCLFRALRDVHSRNIVHRDVKPANFLFDPKTGTGTLCDFGLASRINFDEFQKYNRQCNHGPPAPEFPHGYAYTREELDLDTINHMRNDARKRSGWTSDRVGYPRNETRPQLKVNRAGTRGFRAPEVLLKCPEQTGAIDIWAAGVMLLFFLCGKFPLFVSNNDTEALMEIAAIIGRKKIERAATIHYIGRTFTSNVPSTAISQDGLSWREFCERQNPDLYTTGPPAQESDFNSSTESLELVDSPAYRRAQADLAFDLLEHLLQADVTQRWTARLALLHEWLAEDQKFDDDAFFPHPPGMGVCGDLHFQDTVTGENVVQIGKTVRRLVAGEGIAIGYAPCEFHKDITISGPGKDGITT